MQIQRVQSPAGEAQLKGLVQAHVDATGSSKGSALLQDWSNQLPKFWQLVPPSEAGTPEASSNGAEAADTKATFPPATEKQAVAS